MKIRYNPVVASLLTALGVLCVILNLWLLALGDFEPGLLVGFLVLLLGILHFTRPMCSVHPTYVQVHPLVGPAGRRLPYQTLEFDNGKLIAVDADGSRKRVPITRWMTNSKDFDTLTSRIGRPAHNGGY